MKPNPIDFDKVLIEFKKLGETGNVAVIVTVAVVFLIYIFVLVIVRKADKKDKRNVSMIDSNMSLFIYGIKIHFLCYKLKSKVYSV